MPLEISHLRVDARARSSDTGHVDGGGPVSTTLRGPRPQSTNDDGEGAGVGAPVGGVGSEGAGVGVGPGEVFSLALLFFALLHVFFSNFHWHALSATHNASSL